MRAHLLWVIVVLNVAVVCIANRTFFTVTTPGRRTAAEVVFAVVGEVERRRVVEAAATSGSVRSVDAAHVLDGHVDVDTVNDVDTARHNASDSLHAGRH